MYKEIHGNNTKILQGSFKMALNPNNAMEQQMNVATETSTLQHNLLKNIQSPLHEFNTQWLFPMNLQAGLVPHPLMGLGILIAMKGSININQPMNIGMGNYNYIMGGSGVMNMSQQQNQNQFVGIPYMQQGNINQNMYGGNMANNNVTCQQIQIEGATTNKPHTQQ